MDIKDNTFSRHFETIKDGNLIIMEYSFQEKKIFLTKITKPDTFTDEHFIDEYITAVLEIAIERKFKVVPILPRIAKFFKLNPIYRDLLPPGIRL